MIDPLLFIEVLKRNDITFFSGVPDSILRGFCDALASTNESVVAVNEGSAVALSVGYHLATGCIPLVYMQNSGLGNAINPLSSLAHKNVYSIPMILLIGWRGEPGVPDEPQHMVAGSFTTALLDMLDIPWKVLHDGTVSVDDVISVAVNTARETNHPYALLVSKGVIGGKQTAVNNEEFLSRSEALTIISQALPGNSRIFSTTGKLSRELIPNKRHTIFMNVGAMGHVSQIALGYHLQTGETVYIFDGDGSLLMHMGGMMTIAHKSKGNIRHILFNNNCHESVGITRTGLLDTQICDVALSLGYKYAKRVESASDIRQAIDEIQQVSGPAFLEVVINTSSSEDLPRPQKSLVEYKRLFMDVLKHG